LDIALYGLGAMTIAGVIRIIVGPTAEDRMVGLNLVTSLVLSLLVLTAVRLDKPIYLDVALVYAVLGFVSMLALAGYQSGKE
jgi:multicomponent Na+:H+ antiporter subunit F